MARFPEMNWNVSNVAEEFKLFKQRTELCLLDNNITDLQRKLSELGEDKKSGKIFSSEDIINLAEWMINNEN